MRTLTVDKTAPMVTRKRIGSFQSNARPCESILRHCGDLRVELSRQECNSVTRYGILRAPYLPTQPKVLSPNASKGLALQPRLNEAAH